MDWSILSDPDVLKFGAAALGLGAGFVALTEKVFSARKKPSPTSIAPSFPTTQTFVFYFGGQTSSTQPVLKKNF